MPSFSVADPTAMVRPGPLVSDLAPNSRNTGFSGQHPVDIMPMPGREPVHLPPNASSTLFVEGLPTDCTQREVARILLYILGNFTNISVFLPQTVASSPFSFSLSASLAIIQIYSVHSSDTKK